MANPMTTRGVGPALMALCGVLCVPAFLVKYLRPEFFRIEVVPYWALAAAGAVLIILSLVLHEASVGPMKRAFAEGRFLTAGTFALCRNPIYASAVVFGIPGVMLVLNTWLGLLSVVPMWMLVRIMTRREDRYLEEKFGDEFREYRRRTPAVLPVGWLCRLVVKPRESSD